MASARDLERNTVSAHELERKLGADGDGFTSEEIDRYAVLDIDPSLDELPSRPNGDANDGGSGDGGGGALAEARKRAAILRDRAASGYAKNFFAESEEVRVGVRWGWEWGREG